VEDLVDPADVLGRTCRVRPGSAWKRRSRSSLTAYGAKEPSGMRKMIPIRSGGEVASRHEDAAILLRPLEIERDDAGGDAAVELDVDAR